MRVVQPEAHGFRGTLAALRELAAAERGGSRALCRGSLRGARLGLGGAHLLLFGFAKLDEWRRSRAALR